jgi:hypothetical protein
LWLFFPEFSFQKSVHGLVSAELSQPGESLQDTGMFGGPCGQMISCQIDCREMVIQTLSPKVSPFHTDLSSPKEPLSNQVLELEPPHAPKYRTSILQSQVSQPLSSGAPYHAILLIHTHTHTHTHTHVAPESASPGDEI